MIDARFHSDETEERVGVRDPARVRRERGPQPPLRQGVSPEGPRGTRQSPCARTRSNRLVPCVLTLLALAGAAAAPVAPAGPAPGLVERLDRIFNDEDLAGAELGVCVIDLA